MKNIIIVLYTFILYRKFVTKNKYGKDGVMLQSNLSAVCLLERE